MLVQLKHVRSTVRLVAGSKAVKLIDRILDWLHGRRKNSVHAPAQVLNPSQPLRIQSILDDYDLHMLIQGELNAIKPNLDKIRPAIKEIYIRLGGNHDNAKLIVQKIAGHWIKDRLENEDLPGPIDSYIKPKVLEMANTFIGKAFDDFFAEGSNVSTSGADD